ncbi:MAG: arylamine N-acetyltransferase [Oscillospiraceae bacterium]|jgi:N-hydroxyarylamine O-acetyltransferase|nr:arylamine N-acetyltransferase [Oscillospiraceae bacterium]
MTEQELNLTQYFSRIGYAGQPAPTTETLFALHTAHTQSIPFENLDVVRGRAISLNPQSLFDKLVTRRRGGYCFEMNGLFSRVLSQLGFSVTRLLARSVIAPGVYTAKLHEVMRVDVSGECFLCDVGYGNDGISAPIPLNSAQPQEQSGSTYRITHDEKARHILERLNDGGFIPMYIFTEDECVPADFEVASHYTSTHPESFFRMMSFATMPTKTGRVTLTDGEFKTVAHGETAVRKLSGKDEFSEVLKDVFGISTAEE